MRPVKARYAFLVLVGSLVLLASCSGEAGDAIRSRASDAIASASVSVPSLPSRSDRPTGPTGETGEPVAPTGPTGETGEPVAPTGPTAPTGETGPAAPTGETGNEGPTAPTGPTGPTAPAGETGVTGPTAPTAPTGATGPTAPTGETGATPSGAAETSTGLPWPWLVVGLLVLAGVATALLLRRSSIAKARTAWRVQARSVGTDARALHGRVASELPVVRSGAALPATLWAEVEPAFTALAESLRQLQADAPDEASRTAAQDLFLATDGVRSSTLLVHEATGDAEVRRGLGETLAERLAAMDASIARFGVAVDPGSVPSPAQGSPPTGPTPPTGPAAGP